MLHTLALSAAKPQAAQRRMMEAYIKQDGTSDTRQDPEQRRAFGFELSLYLRLVPEAEVDELLGLAQVHHLDSQQAFVLSSCM